MFFCLKIVLAFTNSVDPDEMQHFAAFHLGLHCLQKYPFKGFPNTKGEVHITLMLRTLQQPYNNNYFIVIVAHL